MLPSIEVKNKTMEGCFYTFVPIFTLRNSNEVFKSNNIYNNLYYCMNSINLKENAAYERL